MNLLELMQDFKKERKEEKSKNNFQKKLEEGEEKRISKLESKRKAESNGGEGITWIYYHPELIYPVEGNELWGEFMKQFREEGFGRGNKIFNRY